MPQSTVVRKAPTTGKQAALDAHEKCVDFAVKLRHILGIDAQPDFGTRTPTKKHHPEQGDDEIFMGNTVPSQCHIGWKTKRFGKYAYNAHGKLITNNEYVPAFIKKQEVREALANEQIDADRRRVWEKMLVEGQ